MEQVGKLRKEVGLQERLAAGEGDAAAGRGEDIRVRGKRAGEFGDGPEASADDLRPLGTSPCERREVVGLMPKRADIIPAGLAILEAVMQKYGIASMILSNQGNMDGYLKKKFRAMP